MTVSYSDNYFKILSLWRGSAWKAVWKELLFWLFLYYAIKVTLEFAVPPSKEQKAHQVVSTFYKYTDKVPLQFLLGFYVGQVLRRWWNQVTAVPWPDDIMSWVCALLPEDSKDSRLRRHAVARYLVLSEALVLRSVSTRIRKRFPTVELLVSAGLMTEEELKLYQQCPCPNTRWQLPILWAINGVLIPVTRRKQNPLPPGATDKVIGMLTGFQSNLRDLFMYDWICIPLVYTQTVSVVVYGYFAMCLIGHQTFGNDTDIYVPVLTILQFVFYVGWFKVAQDLMRPFGEDDDDVELNYLLDRHLAVAFSLAHSIDTNPRVAEDTYFQAIGEDGNKREGLNLAYTKIALAKNRDHPPKLQAGVEIKVPDVDLVMSYKPPPALYHASTDSTNSLSSQQSQTSTKSIIKWGLQKLRRPNVKCETVFF